VRCNQFVKFDYLMKKADELGCEFLATGHYAVREENRLFKGVDVKKDQAYFLYVIYNADIRRVLFPLGKMTKEEIRRIATDMRLSTAQKPESQDICFVEDGGYVSVLEPVLRANKGPIVDMTGTVVGTHGGIFKYTVGQRKGLGALGRKMFVKEINAVDNTIVVGTEDDLWAKTIEVTDAIIAPGFAINPSVEYGIQVRYRSKPVQGKIQQHGLAEFAILLSEPVRAIAPGQSAVFYDKDMVIGGGIIKNAR
jgi:tRNA-specific 2-thiouridylase